MPNNYRPQNRQISFWGGEALEYRGLNYRKKFRWIEEVLIRFKYHFLKRDERGVIRWYAGKLKGYSRSQIRRLIKRYKETWH